MRDIESEREILRDRVSYNDGEREREIELETEKN